uniref:Cytochrome P450 CYP314A1v2 n=1 Tax=Laodelphax striatellus TaxID=195883 RepID=K4JQD8_LAOST|nr:cytochrome P450 CYP314A1v2 [Laodelphax striatellus]
MVPSERVLKSRTFCSVQKMLVGLSRIWVEAGDIIFSLATFSWGCLYMMALVVVFLFLLVMELPPSWWKKRKPFTVIIEEKPSLKDIPGPLALPILGTRWIYSVRYDMDKVHEAYRDMFQRYGNVVKEEALWNFPVISLISKEDIEKVLRKSSKYPLRPPTEVTAHYRATRPDRYTNGGLVNEQGETWHKLCKLLTPELTSVQTMKQFLPEVNHVIDDFIRLIETSADQRTGAVTHFEELCNRVGLESTCTLILGRRMGFLERDSTSTVARKLAEAIQVHFCASRDTFYGLPFWKIFPTAAYKLLVQSEESIYDVVSQLVDSALSEERDTCKVEPVQSVFISILQTPGLDMRDRKAAIIDFIAAGIKTLGNTLVFLLYLIAKNKRAQNVLYEQLMAVIPSGNPITSNTLREIPYLRACLTEAFRLLPTAPCIARILEEDLKVSDGHQLYAGNVVLCHTWLACQDEKNFSRANEFLPERWLSNNELKKSPFLTAPFGVGRRMCPAKRFVHLELQVVLAKIVQHFELDYEGELGLYFEFLLGPRAPTKFIFKRRNT